MKNLLWIAFGIMLLAQIAVPAKMVWESERNARIGLPFKFRCQALDPRDVFRGKYVQLDFSANQFQTDTFTVWERGQAAYAILDKDSLGYASVSDVLAFEPMLDNYLKINILYSQKLPDSSMQTLMLEYPFSRYYMEESKAPLAEQIYGESIRDTSKHVYAEVAVYRGKGTLRDLKVGEQSMIQLAGERK